MIIDYALEETGCAIFRNGDCVTSVERLPDEEYLLMTRRGVCILQCMHVKRKYLNKRYEGQDWTPARVHFYHQTVVERQENS